MGPSLAIRGGNDIVPVGIVLAHSVSIRRFARSHRIRSTTESKTGSRQTLHVQAFGEVDYVEVPNSSATRSR